VSQGGGMTDDVRFEFGKNWQEFLRAVDDQRIEAAATSLQEMLNTDRLDGKSFLDAGCGSGLFSLAARRLGASVRCFDFDDRSVGCASELKRRYYPEDPGWIVEKGSVLDAGYLASLGKFDVVYSWGVLHHTGAMWDALGHACDLVGDGGRLCVSIYNDLDYVSCGWLLVKRTYHRLPSFLRPCLVLAVAIWQFAARLATTLAAVVLRLVSLRNPFFPISNWFREGRQRRHRGMHWWHDLVDWVGGYPFEVAKPEAVFNFCRGRGFALTYLTTQGRGHGCNEFVFVKCGAIGR
jgi:2-polyprenyl-6-hydroxyphenyl methylase/3-demethylubiquinone-9 3-methyltransferase